VITTYSIVATEWADTKPSTNQGYDLEEPPNKKIRRLTSPLFQINWRRVVLDEAHLIKMRKTNQARSAFALSAERRWCITATPIQNGIMDLYRLLLFLNFNISFQIRFNIEISFSFFIFLFFFFFSSF
jgi:SNF2 family DNA or RNA helicase